MRVLWALISLVFVSGALGFGPDDLYYCGVDPDSSSYPTLIPTLSPDQAAAWSLKQVQAIIRHGDRTQASNDVCWTPDLAVYNCTLTHLMLPNLFPDEDTTAAPRLYRKVYEYGDNDKPGNCSTGQLTSKGYFQQLLHGKQLREAYVDGNVAKLLSETPVASELYLHADDSPRTLQSAQGLLLGLYPPQESSLSHLMDIHTMDVDRSIMFPNSLLCPLVDVFEKQAYASPTLEAYLQNTAGPLFSKIRALTNSTASMDAIPDCVWTHFCNNLPMPDGLQELVQQLTTVASYIETYVETFPNKTAAGRNSIGPLIMRMWNNMKDAMSSSDGYRKFNLFSGHDSTVMPFLGAYGVLGQQWAPLASLVAVELYSNTSSPTSFGVRMVYNGKVLRIPGCNGDICDMSAFEQITQSLIPLPQECPQVYRNDEAELQVRDLAHNQQGHTGKFVSARDRRLLQRVSALSRRDNGALARLSQ